MAHRNVHFFRKQPPIIYNQTYNINVRQCHGGCGGGFMGVGFGTNPMMLMSLLYSAKDMMGSLFAPAGGNSMLNPYSSPLGFDYASFNRYTNPTTMSNVQNQTTPQDKTVSNLNTLYKGVTWVYQDGEFWGAKDGQIVAHGKTFEEANASMQRYLGSADTDIDTDLDTDTSIDTSSVVETDTDTEIDTDNAVDTDIDTDLEGNVATDTDADTDIDQVTEKPTYDIEANTSNIETVKTIPYGGPWHYAHYYTDANGNQLSVTSAEFSQIIQKLKTEMGEVEGNRGLRTLPKEITINGKTYTLMNETEREKLGLRGQSGGADARYTAVREPQTTYSVYETKPGNQRTLLSSGLTQEQANKLKAEKEAENS